MVVVGWLSGREAEYMEIVCGCCRLVVWTGGRIHGDCLWLL